MQVLEKAFCLFTQCQYPTSWQSEFRHHLTQLSVQLFTLSLWALYTFSQWVKICPEFNKTCSSIVWVLPRRRMKEWHQTIFVSFYASDRVTKQAKISAFHFLPAKSKLEGNSSILPVKKSFSFQHNAPRQAIAIPCKSKATGVSSVLNRQNSGNTNYSGLKTKLFLKKNIYIYIG